MDTVGINGNYTYNCFPYFILYICDGIINLNILVCNISFQMIIYSYYAYTRYIKIINKYIYIYSYIT